MHLIARAKKRDVHGIFPRRDPKVSTSCFFVNTVRYKLFSMRISACYFESRTFRLVKNNGSYFICAQKFYWYTIISNIKLLYETFRHRTRGFIIFLKI